jgi:hypothetical protein
LASKTLIPGSHCAKPKTTGIGRQWGYEQLNYFAKVDWHQYKCGHWVVEALFNPNYPLEADAITNQ